MINSNEARLIISAAFPDQFPETNTFEVVMVGKSNVGKSTLINALVNRKRLAYVGQRPGKTRMVNFYYINDDFNLVDVPGYGFANRSAQEQENYAILMESYFSERTEPRGLILIVDCRRGMSDDDYLMLDIAKEQKLPCLIVLSKMDKLPFSKQKNILNKTSQQTGYPVYGFSDLKKESITAIQQHVLRWVEEYHTNN